MTMPAFRCGEQTKRLSIPVYVGSGAAALMRGKVDLAFLRPEKKSAGLTYELLRKEPLIVVTRGDHRLAAQDSVRPEDIVGETLIGVPMTSAPILREVTDRYAEQLGVESYASPRR